MPAERTGHRRSRERCCQSWSCITLARSRPERGPVNRVYAQQGARRDVAGRARAVHSRYCPPSSGRARPAARTWVVQGPAVIGRVPAASTVGASERRTGEPGERVSAPAYAHARVASARVLRDGKFLPRPELSRCRRSTPTVEPVVPARRSPELKSWSGWPDGCSSHGSLVWAARHLHRDRDASPARRPLLARRAIATELAPGTTTGDGSGQEWPGSARGARPGQRLRDDTPHHRLSRGPSGPGSRRPWAAAPPLPAAAVPPARVSVGGNFRGCPEGVYRCPHATYAYAREARNFASTERQTALRPGAIPGHVRHPRPLPRPRHSEGQPAACRARPKAGCCHPD